MIFNAIGHGFIVSAGTNGGQSDGSARSLIERLRDTFSGLDERIQSLGAEIWNWFTEMGPDRALWLGVAIAIFVALRFLRAIVAGFMRTSKKGDEHPRNVLARLISSTWSLFLLIASFALVAPMMALPENVVGALRTGVIVLGAIQAAVWMREVLTALFVGYATTHAEDRSTLANAATLMRVFIGILVWSVALLFILSNLGVNVTALVAGLGVGGIAIGLAAQGIFSDLFASLSIVFDKPFVKGDFVKFSDTLGNVEKIGLKTTRIRALSGEQVVISNSKLLGETIQNFALLRERRILFTVGVTYQTPHDKLNQIPGWIKSIIEETEDVRFDRSNFKSFDDSSLSFETVYFVQDPDYNRYMDLQEQINLKMYEKFEKEGVDFAYPTRTLHVVSAAPDE